jgi:hypothetical protein
LLRLTYFASFETIDDQNELYSTVAELSLMATIRAWIHTQRRPTGACSGPSGSSKRLSSDTLLLVGLNDLFDLRRQMPMP